ncbi:MAG: hypothetical protein K9M44_01965 [Candidatus Pacebacteria bacterium]|nr:hypothetical protein [Candidatus Paceibacterota bacterium]
MLRKVVKKICLISIFLYIFLINSQYTDADIFAERIVKENFFSAVSLDFKTKASFNNYDINNLFYITGALPYGFDVEALKIESSTEREFKYNIRTIKRGGDDYLCSSLYLEVLNRELRNQYRGPLIEFSISSDMIYGSPESFIFLVGLNEGGVELQNKSCNFDFYVRSYRDNPSESGGIFAERKLNNIISTTEW